MDYNQIKADKDIVSVISKHVTLKKRGADYVGKCPFHEDGSPSMYVYPKTGTYKCYGCGEYGDHIDFLMGMGATRDEAIADLTGDSSFVLSPKQREQLAKAAEWTQISPAPEPSTFAHPRYGEPVTVYTYRNADGTIHGYDLRFEPSDDKKQILPYTYGHIGDEPPKWKFRGQAKPRKLYNLDRLTDNSKVPVMIGEGCKTADSLQAAFDKAVATTWAGGFGSAHYVDWSPLAGRRVFIWPDNDWEGLCVAYQIAHYLGNIGASVKIVRNPIAAPFKWDHADSGWTPLATKSWVNSADNKYLLPEPIASDEGEYWVIHCPVTGEAMRELVWNGERFNVRMPQAVDEVVPDEHYDDTHEYYDEPIEQTKDWPFTVLGFVKSELGKQQYVFFQNSKKTVLIKTAAEITKSALIELADVNWWIDRFPKGNKTASIDEDAAKNSLIRICEEQGIFNIKMIRGRGAWIDRGRVVLHAGDRLVVDGVDVGLDEFLGDYMYEIGEPMNFNLGNPLSNAKAYRFIEFCKQLPWDRDLNAYMLAGWCVIAPVCGALDWRPHIWLTGGAGSGKSWTLKNVIRGLTGFCALGVQGNTSEAGIRQALTSDAIPVVFDEAEPSDPRANDRISSVLDLMRSASADDGGNIYKGTSGGLAQSYKIRSCFAFASIVVPLDRKSDRRRITIMSMNDRHKLGKEEIERLWLEVAPEGFEHQLLSRTLSLMPVILKNARTFTRAAAATLDSQSIGDQVGSLLAGAYSLHSAGEITFDDAVKWIKDRDWSEEKESVDSDEKGLLNILMEQLTQVDSFNGHRVERTIGELVAIVSRDKLDGDVGWVTAENRLRRIGFKADREWLIISNTSETIKNMLSRTGFAKNHSKVLQRIPGSKPTKPGYFAEGSGSRGVAIPITEVLGPK